jgi:hypothetical protein
VFLDGVQSSAPNVFRLAVRLVFAEIAISVGAADYDSGGQDFKFLSGAPVPIADQVLMRRLARGNQPSKLVAYMSYFLLA